MSRRADKSNRPPPINPGTADFEFSVKRSWIYMGVMC